MTPLVNQYNRTRAKEDAQSIMRHLLDRIWDAHHLARNAKTPDEAIKECAKLAALANKAQQAAHVWKGLYGDWLSHEPIKAEEPDPAVTETLEVQIEKEKS